jgi:hypothetical protein
MLLNLSCGYKLKSDEMMSFIDTAETAELQRRMNDACTFTDGQGDTGKKALITLNVRTEYLQQKSVELNARVSSYLLRTMMGFKYKESMPRTEGNAMPGKWWGKMLDELDEYPEELELSPNQAAWITGVWFEEKVQNSWQSALQKWVNTFEEEMTRLRDLCQNPKSELSVKDS